MRPGRRVDGMDAQEEGVRFAEIVLGVEVSKQPPPPGSKLARLIALEQELAEGKITEAELRAAIAHD